MSEKKPDGCYAFPGHALNVPFEEMEDPKHLGMTLRQWYAGMIVQGFASDADRAAGIIKEAAGLGMDADAYVAMAAFGLADAMLAHEAAEREGT